MDPNFELDDLIRNIGDFTEDAILVTEAEPIDQPGPKIVWCNRAFTEMTGYTLEDVKGKSPRILQGDTPDRRELDRLRKALENWEACRVELQNFTKDGKPFWVEFIVRPVADSTGFFRYWISVQRETTERRRRASLLETTQRMLDEAPIGLGMLGPDFNLNYLNGQLESYLYPRGCPPLLPVPLQKWLRRAFEGILTIGADAARSKAEAIMGQLSKAPYSVEIELNERWYMLRRALLPDGASLLIVDDVTERHLLRSELDFAMRLESMGQLAGGVAHDFNNFLAVILGNLEIALEDEDKRSRDECINDAIASVLSSREIIRQLLTFARRIPENREEIDVACFLDDFARVVDVACPDSIEKTISNSVGEAKLLTDKAQLQTALLNLVLNAIDAMDGRGKLKVVAKKSAHVSSGDSTAHEPDHEHIVFEVSDTGRGIPSKDLDRVIEPFFSTKPADRGTGLGLATVHGFARQAGGNLKITSKVGKGTTVKLSLPLLLRNEPVAQENDTQQSKLPQGIRVMLVDDDPGIRRILKMFLRDLGWSIDEAESGAVAAARLKEGKHYDLLITDLSMPGDMQGDELVSLARDLNEQTECIILTGNPDYSKDKTSSQNFVLKPVRKKEFLRALATAIG